MTQLTKYLLACSLLLTLLPRQGNAAPGTPSVLRRPAPRITPAPNQTDTLPADTTIESAFTLLDSLFNRPEFLYATVGPDIPADMQPILIRFNNAIAANQQWFMEFRNKYSDQPLPYDPRFGITAAEYSRIRHLQAFPPALVPIDSQTVSVLKDAGFIHFKSNGDEHLLDYLYIDPTHHLLEYGGDTIPFAGVASSGRNSPYGQWQGFVWHLEHVDTQMVLDTPQVTARVVEVNIGIPPDAKKTFIRITYRNIQSGIATANMELTGFIH